MVAAIGWQELCRFDDLMLARAVATSIAAMEYDVCLCSAAGGPDVGGEQAPEGDPARPPHVVLVCPADRHDLAAVLDEIIDEQQDFDRRVAERSPASRRARIVAVMTLAGVGELVLLLAVLDR